MIDGGTKKTMRATVQRSTIIVQQLSSVEEHPQTDQHPGFFQ
jgi:hypothetical protein